MRGSQHAGCAGKVENCVTTVFTAYVTAHGQAWADFDVYMPDRWADDLPRRRAAGIAAGLEFATNRSSRCAGWSGWPTPTPPWTCRAA
jgi:SRSO17 transposase